MSSVPSALQEAIGQAQADYAAANPIPSGAPSTPPAAPGMPTPASPYTENPAAPIGGGAPAMPTASSPTFGQPPITGLSSRTGVSGSFNDQLGKNMDKLAAANPNPGAPGAWARAAVGAVGATLANANIGEIPHGGGAISGITQAAANRQKAQQEAQAQARSNAVAQSEIEKNHEEALEANHRRYISEHLAHLTENKENIKNGQDTLRLLGSQPSAPDVLHEGLTWDQAQTLIAQNKLDLTQHHAYPDGEVQDGEDAQGNPIMRTTYTVVGNMKDVHLNTPDGEDFIKRFNAVHPDQKIDENTVIPGTRFASIEQNLNDVETATAARDESLKQAGIKADDLDQKLEMVKLGPDWNVALAAAGGDPQKAIQAIEMNPRTAKLYPHLQQDVQKLYGGETGLEAVEKDIEIKRHNIATETEKAVADNLKAMGKKPDQVLGDATLTGTDYMKSLTAADPGEAALVNNFGTGRLPVERIAYLAAKNPRLLEEVSLAFPNIRGEKIQSLVNANKEFTTGAAGNSINSANTTLDHLNDVWNELQQSGTWIPGTDSYTRRQNDLNAAVQEYAKFLAAGKQPGEKEIEAARTALDPNVLLSPGQFDPTRGKRDAVQAVVNLLQQKKEKYRTQWKSAMPTAAWNYEMPGEDPAADKIASDILGSNLPGSVHQAPPAPAAEAGVPKEASHIGHDANGNVVGYVLDGKWINLAPAGNTGGAGGSY